MVKWDPEPEFRMKTKTMWQIIQEDRSEMQRQIATNTEVKKANEMLIEELIMMTPLDDIQWNTLDEDLF